MKVVKTGMAVGLLAASSVALALPSFVTVFGTNYKVGKDSELKKASCTVCHVGKTPKLNPYGLDLKKLLTEAKTMKLTPEMLKKVEDLDSDKDGVKNIDESKADKFPGDPKSKPAQ